MSPPAGHGLAVVAGVASYTFEPTVGLLRKSTVYGLNGHRLYYIISLFKVTYKSTIHRINRVAAACRAAAIVVIHTSHVLRLATVEA